MGLSMEGNLGFKIDWASLIVGRKFTIFALFYFVFEGKFPITSPRGGLYLAGRFIAVFFALRVWGAYIWRGLYKEGLIFRILRSLISSKINFKLKTQLMQKWSQQFHILLSIFKSALLALLLGTKFKRIPYLKQS